MSDFNAKMHQIRFPLGELRVLPDPLALAGLLLRGERGREGSVGPSNWGVWIHQ